MDNAWLDLLITKTSCPAVRSVSACDGLSDHFLVLSEREFPRLECVKKKISFMRFDKIDLDNLIKWHFELRLKKLNLKKNFQNSVNNMIPFSKLF